MNRDPTVDHPGFFFYAVAALFAAIASFGWLQGQNAQLVDEIFLFGSWVLTLNSVVGFSFKTGFHVNPRWRRSAYIRRYLVPLSVLATILYLIGNFVLSPIFVAQ